MRSDHTDISVDELFFDPQQYKTENGYREYGGVITHDGLQWILREFTQSSHCHRDRLYHDFFRLFSPYHICVRRSIYEIKEGSKHFIGGAYSAVNATGLTLATSRDLYHWIEQQVSGAFVILFFLNQPHISLEEVTVDLCARYQVRRFDLTVPNTPLLRSQYEAFLLSNDVISEEALRWIMQSVKYQAEWLARRELVLFNIVISPDFKQLFNGDACDDLKENLILRKTQLREILLHSTQFSESVFRLTQDQFCAHLYAFFYCLEKYDPANFRANRDSGIQNYFQFFSEFVNNKFVIMARKLQREIGTVAWKQNMQSQRAMNAFMLKSTLNYFYEKLNESNFFVRFDSAQFHYDIALFRALQAVAIHFECYDVLRKQITALKQLLEIIGYAHPWIGEYIQTFSRMQLDVSELSDTIQIDEIVQYSQDWISRTAVVGSETVLINKNALLLFFDYAIHEIRTIPHSIFRGAPVDFLRSLLLLRQEANQYKTIHDIKRFISSIIRSSASVEWLTIFFRQWILHLHLEFRLGVFMQKMIMQPIYNEKIIQDKIHVLLSQLVTDVAVKEFWNKLLLAFDSEHPDNKWCDIDPPSLPSSHAARAQSAFFDPGNTVNAVTQRAENLLSAAPQTAKSDSAKVVLDSLGSVAAATAHAAGMAAANAKEAVSSAVAFFDHWWNRKS